MVFLLNRIAGCFHLRNDRSNAEAAVLWRVDQFVKADCIDKSVFHKKGYGRGLWRGMDRKYRADGGTVIGRVLS